ncbi:MAG: redoxin domain-containing protein [Armatimonadota bacterium]|nr:redoxin domain-containing protein [Armatimonadota bacterium]
MITFIVASAVLLSPVAHTDDEYGHSRKGTAFDSGMRTRPKKLEGIGIAPFPITAKTPEVQEWFNQGNALLHSFWWEESERAFRWCLKIDPDCAMAYWGLAQGGYNWFAAYMPIADDPKNRYRLFLAEAVKRKNLVSERERMFIEAWERAFVPGGGPPGPILLEELKKIVEKYPDDVEAKALLAFHTVGSGAGTFTTQRLIDHVLAKSPSHPGAHHATIHMWDYVKPTIALQSCDMYGKIAPRIGHALHMPGHAYSKMGMWHEAARSMDAATRTELFYMNDRLALPHQSWNYSHNRNYLCYIQEQLGMAEASIQGAKDLINAPTDPDGDNANNAGLSEGLMALVRAYLKFERWEDILKPGQVAWGKSPDQQMLKAFAETQALAGLGRTKEARAAFAEMKAEVKRFIAREPQAEPFVMPLLLGAEGKVLIAEGNVAGGIKLLDSQAAGEMYGGDPPMAPAPLSRIVGDAYLLKGDHKAAVEAYEKALSKEKNDGFSLSGLARAYHALGDLENARKYAGQFYYVWSGADANLKWTKQVDALNLNVKPTAELPSPERRYVPAELASYGPSNWQPFAAPQLSVLDKDGKPVSLDQYRGKNVLLIFYLNEACVHCVEQLAKINERLKEFSDKNTVVLGVSSTTPEKNRESLKLGDFGITLLSDTAHENARRFASYDDFEEMELHSTILIDKDGKIRWKRTGGDPFMNIDFLLREIARIPK